MKDDHSTRFYRNRVPCIVGAIALSMLWPLATAFVSSPCVASLTQQSLKTTMRVIERGSVKISARQEKPVERHGEFFCRAWMDISVSGKIVKSLYFPDIDPVGGSYGLFVPDEQPLADYLLAMKFGDYDGRLYLVDITGAVFDIPGGWLFLDQTSRYLFSLYGSDQPELHVFDLREKRVVFHADIPNDVEWYRRGDHFIYIELSAFLGPLEGEIPIHSIDLKGRHISSGHIPRAELAKLSKVESPLSKEHKEFHDCQF